MNSLRPMVLSMNRMSLLVQPHFSRATLHKPAASASTLKYHKSFLMRECFAGSFSSCGRCVNLSLRKRAPSHVDAPVSLKEMP